MQQNEASLTYRKAPGLRHRDPRASEPSAALPALDLVAQLVDQTVSECGSNRAIVLAGHAESDFVTEQGIAHLVREGRMALTVGRDHVLAQLVAGLEDAPVTAIMGLAGSGKTTLARELARTWRGPSMYRSAASMAPGDAALGPARWLGAASSDSVLRGSWARLDRTAGLLVLDDLHLLGERAQQLIVDTAARVLVSGRLVVATRERIPLTTHDADHQQVKLAGIDRASAELLWKRLDDSREVTRSFDAAWRYSGGNPLALRNAHAGRPRDHHPVVRAIRGLDGDARRVIEAIAMSRAPMTTAGLAALSPARALETILDDLVTRMFVDARRRGRYTTDPFVRAAVADIADGRGGEASAARRGSPARFATPPAAPARRMPIAPAFIIDGMRHELLAGMRRIRLSSRFMLRRLLYEFATAQAHRLTREAIARALWSVEYDPRRHESSLKSNIRRLRELLSGTNAMIETVENGYRLCLPCDALFVPPDE